MGCAGNAENATRRTIAKYDCVPRPRVAYGDHIGISRWGLGSNAEVAMNVEGMQYAQNSKDIEIWKRQLDYLSYKE